MSLIRRMATLAALLLSTAAVAQAQNSAAVVGGAAQPVVVSGTVPDEATKAAILLKLRELYGSERVVDQLSIGTVVAPANWSSYVQKLIGPSLKEVRQGQMTVDGNTVSINGQVADEAMRQQVASTLALSLNPTYTIKNGLFVGGGDQSLLDTALANRIVEFNSGAASLTPAGQAVLDEMAAALLKLSGKKVEVIGNTDASGNRVSNLALSQSRANAVKDYLVSKGVAANSLSTLGLGSDRPVASNATPEGRARNRRIEFRVQ